MRKKGEASFNNVTMSSSGIVIKFRVMAVNGEVRDILDDKKTYQSLVFISVIKVTYDGFALKLRSIFP